MNVIDALQKRKSVRAYLNKPVEQDKIDTILNSAKHAPSGVNMQPWQVCVVSGNTKKDIESKVLSRFENGESSVMDYHYYPSEWQEPYKSRRKETGLLMYKTLKFEKEDHDKRAKQWAANYRAFDAPVVLYFFVDSNLEKGSYLDYGMFLQSVMLTATELGLGCCPQAALAEYPDIVKQALNIEHGQTLLCGMALGYEDTEAPINQYRTPRIALQDFVRYYD
jgi:nitroreductase